VSQPTRKGLSLHVGLNSVNPAHYAGWSGDLAVCESDAEEMRRLAMQLSYTTQALMTRDATRDAVIGAIRAAAAKLEGGDIFLMTYAGHGGQIPDRNGDEPDSLDETWCLFDGQIVDDELDMLWSGFRSGVRVLVLSDSCHSGSVTRVGPASSLREAPAIPERGVRLAPRDVLIRTFRSHRDFYASIPAVNRNALPIPSACVRLISGCQDDQLSYEGPFNGVFTTALLRAWNQGGFTGDYNAFHGAIVSLMPAKQTPAHFLIGTRNPEFDAERPFTI
jgi:hypothetical protein